mmetsp:Transcript_20234/g.47230  ORF Transcript_20234/g.47230 Transcript_20234/m.47230 type:complete len:479 (+) Transcript_20234:75-1511(+)
MSASALDGLLKEATFRREKGQDLEAEDKLDEALTLVKGEAAKLKGAAKAERLLKVSDVYLAKVNGDFFVKAVFATEAVLAIRAALALYVEAKDEVGQASSLCKLASVHIKKEHYKAAAEDLKQALDLNAGSDSRQQALKLKIDLIGKQAEVEEDPRGRVSKAEEGWILSKQEGVGKSAALVSVVNAYALLGDPAMGLQIADSEYKAADRENDVQGMLDLACPIMTARANCGDFAGALAVADSLMPRFQQQGGKSGEAACLSLYAKILIAMDRPADAIARSRSAVALYAEINDAEGEREAKKVLSQAMSGAGQAEQAPTRVECQKRLGLLQRAIRDKKPLDYERLIGELVDLGGIAQEDFDEAISELIAMDKEGTIAFLREQEGMAVQEAGPGKGEYAREIIKEYNYMHFSVGGLGYGPRFRLSNGYGHAGGKYNIAAYGCVYCGEECEDWEKQLLTHPGMLDSSLHVNNAIQMLSAPR